MRKDITIPLPEAFEASINTRTLPARMPSLLKDSHRTNLWIKNKDNNGKTRIIGDTEEKIKTCLTAAGYTPKESEKLYAALTDAFYDQGLITGGAAATFTQETHAEHPFFQFLQFGNHGTPLIQFKKNDEVNSAYETIINTNGFNDEITIKEFDITGYLEHQLTFTQENDKIFALIHYIFSKDANGKWVIQNSKTDNFLLKMLFEILSEPEGNPSKQQAFLHAYFLQWQKDNYPKKIENAHVQLLLSHAEAFNVRPYFTGLDLSKITAKIPWHAAEGPEIEKIENKIITFAKKNNPDHTKDGIIALSKDFSRDTDVDATLFINSIQIKLSKTEADAGNDIPNLTAIWAALQNIPLTLENETDLQRSYGNCVDEFQKTPNQQNPSADMKKAYLTLRRLSLIHAQGHMMLPSESFIDKVFSAGLQPRLQSKIIGKNAIFSIHTDAQGNIEYHVEQDVFLNSMERKWDNISLGKIKYTLFANADGSFGLKDKKIDCESEALKDFLCEEEPTQTTLLKFLGQTCTAKEMLEIAEAENISANLTNHTIEEITEAISEFQYNLAKAIFPDLRIPKKERNAPDTTDRKSSGIHIGADTLALAHALKGENLTDTVLLFTLRYESVVNGKTHNLYIDTNHKALFKKFNETNKKLTKKNGFKNYFDATFHAAKYPQGKTANALNQMHYAILKEVLRKKEVPLSYEEIRHLINEADRLGVKSDLSGLNLRGCKFDFDVSNTNFDGAILNDINITHIDKIKNCSFKGIDVNTVIHFTTHNGINVCATIKEWNELIRKKYDEGKLASKEKSFLNWAHNEGYLDKISEKKDCEKFFATIEYVFDPKRNNVKTSSDAYRSLGHSFTTEAFHLAVAQKEWDEMFSAQRANQDDNERYLVVNLSDTNEDCYIEKNNIASLTIKKNPVNDKFLAHIFSAIAQGRKIVFEQPNSENQSQKKISLIDALKIASKGNESLEEFTEQLKIFCDWIQKNGGLKFENSQTEIVIAGEKMPLEKAIKNAKEHSSTKGFFGETKKPGKLNKIDNIYINAIKEALKPRKGTKAKASIEQDEGITIPSSGRSNRSNSFASTPRGG